MSNRDYDQTFLAVSIYPIIKNRAMIHANFHVYSGEITTSFIPYDDQYRFVGEYVYSDESRSNSHINDLKQHLAYIK